MTMLRSASHPLLIAALSMGLFLTGCGQTTAVASDASIDGAATASDAEAAPDAFFDRNPAVDGGFCGSEGWGCGDDSQCCSRLRCVRRQCQY